MAKFVGRLCESPENHRNNFKFCDDIAPDEKMSSPQPIKGEGLKGLNTGHKSPLLPLWEKGSGDEGCFSTHSIRSPAFVMA